MGGFFETVRLILPLSEKDRQALAHFREFLDEQDLKKLKRFLKQGKVKSSDGKLGLSVTPDSSFPTLEIATHSKSILGFVEYANKKNEEFVRQNTFHSFAHTALSKISLVIAPQIVGFDTIKEAVALQLFSTESLHLLLLGDPGTGKTEVLRAAQELAPISSFGLGSGMSGVGLTVTVKGKQVQKGLLPMADNGLACIDELNLIKKEDAGGLYNAMEKGFVSYDKLGHHLRFEARISLLATANPRFAQFVGKTIETLKKQLPFDAALLTRFHLVFFVRKPDVKKFVEIAKHIVGQKVRGATKADAKFIKEYIRFAKRLEIEFPTALEREVVDFAERIKKDEKKFLIEVSPRLVIGIIRLAKASALSELRTKVEEKDVSRVLQIVENSLYGSAS